MNSSKNVKIHGFVLYVDYSTDCAEKVYRLYHFLSIGSSILLIFSKNAKDLLSGFSQGSSDSVDMPLKITAVNELCNNKLLKGGNGAGVKSELFLKCFNELFGKHHIAHTQGGRNGFREGVKIDYVILFCKRKERFLRLCRYREF